MPEFAFTIFIISVTVIAGAVAFHYCKKADMREAVIEEAERLMHQFLDNPSQDHFNAAYRHLAINSITMKEVGNDELVEQFITYIKNHQVAQ